METKELRQGNIVNHPEWKNFFSEVLAIKRNGALELTSPIGGVLHTGDFEPVELSIEWLRRFGFKERGGGEWTVGDECYELFDDGFYYTAGEGLRLSQKLEHVHTLQNFHHAVSGQELILQLY